MLEISQQFYDFIKNQKHLRKQTLLAIKTSNMETAIGYFKGIDPELAELCLKRWQDNDAKMRTNEVSADNFVQTRKEIRLCIIVSLGSF